MTLCPSDGLRELLAQDFTGEGKQRQVPGTLYGSRQFALVLGACASLSPGANFPVFMEESP